jgi:hypothetical protein
LRFTRHGTTQASLVLLIWLNNALAKLSYLLGTCNLYVLNLVKELVGNTLFLFAPFSCFLEVKAALLWSGMYSEIPSSLFGIKALSSHVRLIKGYFVSILGGIVGSPHLQSGPTLDYARLFPSGGC